MDYERKSDEALLQLIAKHDTEALEALYDRHAQVVYNLILRIVRSREVADELLQETFWQVWKKADDFRGGTAAAWLYRIARNKSLDQLRRHSARPQPVTTATEEAEQELWNTLEATTSAVDQVIEQRRERREVREALDQIPPEQRLCLELAYFEGMSQSEIAEHIDTPLGTIKTRIRLGLQKLERLLRAAGY
ncbi:MAG: sigma-70 family RNA polymerase sigma factor [Chloroflexota bacterium]|nr:sigma-70 family RNA polymerase sigma factor [Chloroflexota bacterium]